MFGGISIWQLLIIAVIVIAIFGTKKLRNVGSDVGGAVKDFKKAMNDEQEKGQEENKQLPPSQDANFDELANKDKEDSK